MTTLRDSTLSLLGSNVYFTSGYQNRGFRAGAEFAGIFHIEGEDPSGNFVPAITIDSDNQYVGIFNAAPSSTFDVNGPLYASGSIATSSAFYGSGAGLNASSVPIGSLANIATDTLLGRSAVGTGPVSTVVCTAAGRALLDDASNTVQRATLGLGTMAVQNTNSLALNGPMTTSNLAAFTAGDTRLMLMGGSGSPTKAFTLNYSAALDAQGSFTYQRRTTLNAFEATVGGYLIAANQWFFGAAQIGAAFFSINGNTTIAGDLRLNVAGNGIQIAEGANACSGTATLVAGSVVVSTTKVAANSRIHITANSPGGTPGWLRVSARTAGVSFTITSSSGTDTSTVAWMIVQP